MRDKRFVKHLPLPALLCFVFLFCFCASKPVMTLTGADNGTRVEIKTGDVIEVSLEAQLGTGYGWEVVSRHNNLVLVGEPVQAPVGKAKPGGPERQTFRFKAVEKGESGLVLRYAQGWRGDAAAQREFTVTVLVK